MNAFSLPCFWALENQYLSHPAHSFRSTFQSSSDLDYALKKLRCKSNLKLLQCLLYHVHVYHSLISHSEQWFVTTSTIAWTKITYIFQLSLRSNCGKMVTATSIQNPPKRGKSCHSPLVLQCILNDHQNALSVFFFIASIVNILQLNSAEVLLSFFVTPLYPWLPTATYPQKHQLLSLQTGMPEYIHREENIIHHPLSHTHNHVQHTDKQTEQHLRWESFKYSPSFLHCICGVVCPWMAEQLSNAGSPRLAIVDSGSCRKWKSVK